MFKSSSDGVSRRHLLTGAALAVATGAGAAASAGGAAAQTLPPAPAAAPAPASPPAPPEPEFSEPPPREPPDLPATSGETFAPGAVDWGWVRSQWSLNWQEADLSAMLFAANPRPVRDAIDRHRRGLDSEPVRYLERNNRPLQNLARASAGRYFNVPQDNVALCESTTSGLALLYNGIVLHTGQEVLTTVHDYYSTHESLRMACARTGASVRRITLFNDPREARIDLIVSRIVSNIRPETRVLALTWVHSSTGFKMPIRQIALGLAAVNAGRPPQDKVLFCVDGVHGFGVENATLPELGCDFLVAGCHKWLFGPRGTGVVLGTTLGWSRVKPTVPTFLAPNAYGPWIGGYDPGPTTAARMTPGGFKAFEHVWSMTEAFQFQQKIGKPNVAARTVELAGRVKSGLARLSHIHVQTPTDPALSAGIVSFDIAGLPADAVVDRLRTFGVIASASPYAQRHVRLTPSIRNTHEEIDLALASLDHIRPRPKKA